LQTKTSARWQTTPGSFDALHTDQLFPAVDDNPYGIPLLPHAPLSYIPEWLAPYRTRIRAKNATSGGGVHFFWMTTALRRSGPDPRKRCNIYATSRRCSPRTFRCIRIGRWLCRFGTFTVHAGVGVLVVTWFPCHPNIVVPPDNPKQQTLTVAEGWWLKADDLREDDERGDGPGGEQDRHADEHIVHQLRVVALEPTHDRPA